MTSPWQRIDWDADRPDAAAVQRSRDKLTYQPVPVTGPDTATYLAAVGASHVNGGALLARFQVAGDDGTMHWFSARNRFSEYGLVSHALNAPAVRETLPKLRIPDPLSDPRFEGSWSGTLTLDGELAATIVLGGAYRQFPGTRAEAKLLAAGCVTELFGDRHEDCHVYRSSAAWTPWFFGIAWDATWIVIDARDALITLLCVTDTD